MDLQYQGNRAAHQVENTHSLLPDVGMKACWGGWVVKRKGFKGLVEEDRRGRTHMHCTRIRM